MRVLHLVAGDLNGGAGRGALWLHQGLLTKGVESRILHNSRRADVGSGILSISESKKDRVKNAIRCQADQFPLKFYRHRTNANLSSGLFGYDFRKSEHYKWADIVHLHWVNAGLVNTKHLHNFRKPLVWTLRDMWPMTGGCHYTNGCDRYADKCGKCPQLRSRYKKDLSSFVLKRKQRYLKNDGVVLVGISEWISECARKSSLFSNFDIRTIHNNVNCADYYPYDKDTARLILDVPRDRPIVLVGAQNNASLYKGFDLFLAAAEHFPKDYFVLIFGKLDSTNLEKASFDFMELGFLHDAVSLRLAYSAADVFVAPSRMDAFGKTLVEAMACGTPVVCFDATGPRDIVTHKEDGYRAKPYDPQDFAGGIDWILNQDNKGELSRTARQKVLAAFDSSIISDQYAQLYEEIHR